MSKTMISFTDAIDTIHHTIKPLSPEIKPISDGLGLVLADDIFSPIDIPGFNQSAMDGYAIKLGDDKVKNAYVIGGEVGAGEQPAQYNNAEVAVRIFTRAALPDGFDTVVMQEKTSIQDEKLFITDENLIQGQNIRLQGAEIKIGALAIKKGTLLSPATKLPRPCATVPCKLRSRHMLEYFLNQTCWITWTCELIKLTS